ncbi:MAG TPA: MraY family glycosyltransferase [Actinomycetota bacterium]|jgi:UDP-GlcNAc:undecaprenyl-phosphate GlcNAc-1-phosphate transferase
MRFLIALAAAGVLTPVAGWAGRAVGLVDRPGALKIHLAPVPLTGGLAVVAVAIAVPALLGFPLPVAVLGAVLVALAAGTADDARPISPWLRLAVQVGAGLLLVAGGLRVAPFGILGAAGVVVVVIACTNAVNLLDGQDGLAGGLCAVAALGLASLNPALGTGALVLAGALCGFLLWNRPPARVYLGNGGAYAVGVLLAAMSVGAAGTSWRGVLGAGAVLGVLVFEFTLTLARRIRARSAVAEGDRLHSYDLMARAVGRGASTVAFWGLGLVAALVGLLLARGPLAAGAAAAAVTAVGGALLVARLWSRHAMVEDSP